MTERIPPAAGGGAWEQAARSVNGMLDGISGPIAEIDRVIEALADGELSEAVAHPVDLAPDGRTLRGDVLRKARAVNRLASQLKEVHDAIAWLAATIGGEIALSDNPAATPFRPDRMPGEWSELIGAMDHSWNRLGGQVQEVLQVTSAVADGDLSRKVQGPASGAMAGLKTTINDMVDQLSDFSSEVTRVTREVGTEGRLGGQANVPGVGRDLARPDRVGQLDGLEPDRAGPRHSRRDHRRWPRRPVAEDHGRGRGRDAGAEGDHQHDGRPALRLRGRGHPSGPRGGYGRASSAARRRCPASRGPGRT